MVPADRWKIVGGLVYAKAKHVINAAEYSRLFGACAKEKELPGKVVEVYQQRTSNNCSHICEPCSGISLTYEVYHIPWHYIYTIRATWWNHPIAGSIMVNTSKVFFPVAVFTVSGPIISTLTLCQGVDSSACVCVYVCVCGEFPIEFFPFLQSWHWLHCFTQPLISSVI